MRKRRIEGHWRTHNRHTYTHTKQGVLNTTSGAHEVDDVMDEVFLYYRSGRNGQSGAVCGHMKGYLVGNTGLRLARAARAHVANAYVGLE